MMTLKRYTVLFSTLLLISQPSPKSDGQDVPNTDTLTRVNKEAEAIKVVGRDSSATAILVHIKDSLERRKIALFSKLLANQNTLTKLHTRNVNKRYTKIYKEVVLPIYVPIAEADLYSRITPKKDTVSPIIYTPEKTLPKKKGFLHRLFSKDKIEN